MRFFSKTNRAKVEIRNGIGVCMLAFLIFSVSACSSEPERPTPPSRESVEVRPMVVFDLADDEPVFLHVETQGRVEPIRKINIQPRISGFVESHTITDGVQVNRGDTLLSFVDDEWRLDLESASEEYQKSLAAYTVEKNLRFRDSVPPENSPEIISLKNQYGISQAEINRNRAALMLTYAHLVAPFDGFISTNENLSTGQYISAGTQLGEFVDQSTVRVRFDVLESELEQIQPGMEVLLTTAGGRQVSGQVQNLSPVVDPDSKTGQVIALFENSEGFLRSGMTVDGRILIEKIEGRTRAPRSAMLQRDGRPLVFKLIDDTVHWVYIEPLAYTSEWVVFTHNDISPGDTLAVDRHFAISHLQKIEPRMN